MACSWARFVREIGLGMACRICRHPREHAIFKQNGSTALDEIYLDNEAIARCCFDYDAAKAGEGTTLNQHLRAGFQAVFTLNRCARTDQAMNLTQIVPHLRLIGYCKRVCHPSGRKCLVIIFVSRQEEHVPCEKREVRVNYLTADAQTIWNQREEKRQLTLMKATGQAFFLARRVCNTHQRASLVRSRTPPNRLSGYRAGSEVNIGIQKTIPLQRGNTHLLHSAYPIIR